RRRATREVVVGVRVELQRADGRDQCGARAGELVFGVRVELAATGPGGERGSGAGALVSGATGGLHQLQVGDGGDRRAARPAVDGGLVVGARFEVPLVGLTEEVARGEGEVRLSRQVVGGAERAVDVDPAGAVHRVGARVVLDPVGDRAGRREPLQHVAEPRRGAAVVLVDADPRRGYVELGREVDGRVAERAVDLPDDHLLAGIAP